MARKASKKVAKRSSRGNGAAKAAATVKLSMDAPDEANTFYINHAETGHTQHEFSLIVGKLPAKLSPMARQLAQESGEFKVQPILQLLFPTTLIQDLIDILTVQKGKYEKQYGEIRRKGKSQKGSSK
jgi:hypothetical protein